MKINLDDLYPWAEINSHFTRMKKMRVSLNGDDLGNECELVFDATTGTATLAFKSRKPAKVKRFDDVYDPMEKPFPGQA